MQIDYQILFYAICISLADDHLHKFSWIDSIYYLILTDFYNFILNKK